MNRYFKEKSEVRYDGKKYFLTHSFFKPEVRDSDIIYISKKNDKLDSLAYKFYKDETLWWIISMYNNIAGRMSIPEGLQLRIPTDIDIILNTYKSINN